LRLPEVDAPVIKENALECRSQQLQVRDLRWFVGRSTEIPKTKEISNYTEGDMKIYTAISRI